MILQYQTPAEKFEACVAAAVETAGAKLIPTVQNLPMNNETVANHTSKPKGLMAIASLDQNRVTPDKTKRSPLWLLLYSA